MFTIKQITKNGERLWEGYGITYDDGRNSVPAGKPQVSFQMADVGTCTIDAGDVFIMNSTGNTVSKYHLENGLGPQ